jgi:pimeloyl-ACP methyl ester carboxylesterase
MGKDVAMRWLLVALMVAVLLSGMPGLASVGAQVGTPVSGSPVAGSGDFAGLVDLGEGRRLYLECRGEGSPTVILEAGAGNTAASWDTGELPPGSQQTAVLPGVATFTRVCAYDRLGAVGESGEARSDPASAPRDAGAMVGDLHALLQAAAIPGPYVLAGHSFGGLIARLYATTYPDEVVGLVLIDAAHEDYYDVVRTVLTPEQWAAFAPPPDATDAEATIERIDVDASAREMREAMARSSLRPMPVIVLTHGLPWTWPEGYPVADLEAVWLPLQEDLAAIVPDGRLIVAEQSGHFIPGDEPEVVTAAIRAVVEAVRDPASWETTAATPVA